MEHASCPPSKRPLDCSGMAGARPPARLHAGSAPHLPAPAGPRPAQNGCHPSEAAILGAQTVASLGMGLGLHGNLRPSAPSSLRGGWAAEMGVFQARPRCPRFPLSSQRPRGDEAPHQLPSPNARGSNRWHLWVSFSFRLLPSISGCVCLSVTASPHLWVYRGACMPLYVHACLCVRGHTCVVPLSSLCLRRAHPTPPSVPIFSCFFFYCIF